MNKPTRNSEIELPKVTTGPLPASRKVYSAPEGFPDVGVPLREIALSETSGEVLSETSAKPSVRVYDSSGPYTDDKARIDIMAGLPALRRDWIIGRGDVEEYDGRGVKPEDNGLKGPDRSGGVAPFPNVVQRPLRAKAGQNVSQMHYARRGIITPEMEYVAIRENVGRAALKEKLLRDGEDFGAEIPDFVTPEFVRSEVARGSIAYSAVTQPLPLPVSQRGTPFVNDAVHSTLVRPNEMRALPSAWSLQPRSIVTSRSWSAERPSCLVIVLLSEWGWIRSRTTPRSRPRAGIARRAA